jgi:hypothetical protein
MIQNNNEWRKPEFPKLWQWQETNKERSCGSCSMCCKFFIIPEVDKAKDEWCRHCRPGKGGCTIYEQRPQVCKDFICMWKYTTEMGDEWYPARCKMVLVDQLDKGRILVKVDPTFPSAWRKEPYYSQFLEWSWEFCVVVNVGKTALRLRNGVEENLSYSLEAEEAAAKRFAERNKVN